MNNLKHLIKDITFNEYLAMLPTTTRIVEEGTTLEEQIKAFEIITSAEGFDNDLWDYCEDDFDEAYANTITLDNKICLVRLPNRRYYQIPLEYAYPGVTIIDNHIESNKVSIYRYSCDAGSIAILCGESIIRINNRCGDGSFTITIKDYKPIWEDPIKDVYDFITSCEFVDAKLLSYDCFRHSRPTPEDVLCTLNGEYYIYVDGFGNFIFERDNK